MDWNNVVAILVPIVLIEVGFRVYAIVDILKPERKVKFFSKKIWLVIVGLVNFGWVFYLIGGRQDVTINR
jgi:hypothetical protein